MNKIRFLIQNLIQNFGSKNRLYLMLSEMHAELGSVLGYVVYFELQSWGDEYPIDYCQSQIVSHDFFRHCHRRHFQTW